MFLVWFIKIYWNTNFENFIEISAQNIPKIQKFKKFKKSNIKNEEKI